MVAQDDISNVAQAILTNILTGSCSSRSIKAVESQSFNGSRDKAEQFIQSTCIAVTMQLNTLFMPMRHFIYLFTGDLKEFKGTTTVFISPTHL